MELVQEDNAQKLMRLKELDSQYMQIFPASLAI